MKKLFFLLFLINSFVFYQDNFQPFASLEGEWILDKSFSDDFDKKSIKKEN